MPGPGHRRVLLAAALAGVLLLGLVPTLAQEDFGFMPKGGKTLLLELSGAPADATRLRGFTESRRSEAEWRETVNGQAKGIADRELRELSAYLAVNMPLPEGALDQAAARRDPASALPADGRELAWNQCQFCHSLFTGYLMHSRDVQGWRNIFLSPFHRGIKMTEQQRDTFAYYSAINMPMKTEDVPADLRY